DVERRVDWRAARGEPVLLGAAALVPIAASGHAAAVEPSAALAIAADGVHLLATGVWAGGLLPLALLLRAAGRDGGADARPYAARAPRAARVAVRLPPLAGGARGRVERGPAGAHGQPGRGARPDRDDHRAPPPCVAAAAPRRGNRPSRRGRRPRAAAARHRRL